MSPRARHVLLVEDDRAWALLTREAFRDVAPDVEVEVAETGTLALERLRAEPRPDAVVLDLNLPGMDGLEVLRAIRSRPARPDQVVVVLSASVAPGDRRAVEVLGADAHRQKPTSYSELRDLASEIVDGRLSAPPDEPGR
jgi:CheY-like chemotaxis protein